MKRWWLAVLLVLSVGINIGLFLGRSWQPRPAAEPTIAEDEAPEQRQTRRFIHRVADELGLDGERREQFLDLQGKYFRRALENRREIVRLRRQMRRNLMSNAADRAQAEATLEQLIQHQGDLERAFIDNYFDSRELLGPRQERKLRRFLSQVRKRQSELMRRAESRRTESRRRPGERRLRSRASDGRRKAPPHADSPALPTEEDTVSEPDPQP